MASCTIRGIPVQFPFEPYELQKDYMDKVIDCLQNRQNGILESPTGTGKTLSLLCSSLAWLEMKKAQIQAQRQAYSMDEASAYLDELKNTLNNAVSSGKAPSSRNFLGVPRIIYASRTHTQLAQAMQELKRTAYKHMTACVLGSREQLCIHPEVVRENNHAMKVLLCRLKLKSRTCDFFNKVERMKGDPKITNNNIMDIEDLVKLGDKHRFCPYYMSKELKEQADIVFMPYNYLLDPKARKALGVEVNGNVIILDEAHNIEKVCEESASLQIKSTDVTLAIEEVTVVMKALSETPEWFSSQDAPKDFDADELCVLKQMLLDFERQLDGIDIKKGEFDGATFDGNFIFEILAKCGINDSNHMAVTGIMEKLIQFLATVSEGPFQRKGNGLQVFLDLLIVAFASVKTEFKSKMRECYKVHVAIEEQKRKTADNWLTKATKANSRVLNFWCFSPGFGMNMLMDQGIHCVILTSGTLAPLKPLISELELNIGVQLENPHIVKGDQICVKIISKGPDQVTLSSNYQNRDNPSYLSSLGNTILNLSRLIPNGILIFFSSYPLMEKCKDHWQQQGIWANINNQKSIFVEPKDKVSFNAAMTDYYAKINDPKFKGAIFMGVCRGKISEGLDFADINGRAVFITGLPFPPMKDPRVILKKRYLDLRHSKDREFLTGNEWYSLEATRAVNQAIGRVIRHRHDYGAIILLDSRFCSYGIRNQMSMWLRDHVKVVENFGEGLRDLRMFFKRAQETLPTPAIESSTTTNMASAEFDQPQTYRSKHFDFSTSSSSALSSNDTRSGEVNINKRPGDSLANALKKKKIVIIQNTPSASSTNPSASGAGGPTDTSIKEYIAMVKKALDVPTFKRFVQGLTAYRTDSNFAELCRFLDEIFLNRHHLRYIIQGLGNFVKAQHKEDFESYWQKMK